MKSDRLESYAYLLFIKFKLRITYKTKTTETANSVSDFVKTVEDEQKQKDCLALIEAMKKRSGFEPTMWGPSIIGFDSYHYKYESGHEGDAPLVSLLHGKLNLPFTLPILMVKKIC